MKSHNLEQPYNINCIVQQRLPAQFTLYVIHYINLWLKHNTGFHLAPDIYVNCYSNQETQHT